ncbi:hypothetical protein AQ611_12090 [Burkholderia singularis]|nr:hypothetical protein AQ611_12090 [Burkholderia sp. Bp7605]
MACPAGGLPSRLAAGWRRIVDALAGQAIAIAYALSTRPTAARLARRCTLRSATRATKRRAHGPVVMLRAGGRSSDVRGTAR